MDVGGDSESLVVRADIVWEQIWSKYIYISDLINTNPSGSNAKPAAASLWLHKEFAVFRMLLCNQKFACKITRLFALPDVPLADLISYFLFPLPTRITQVLFLLQATLVVKSVIFQLPALLHAKLISSSTAHPTRCPVGKRGAVGEQRAAGGTRTVGWRTAP